MKTIAPRAEGVLEIRVRDGRFPAGEPLEGIPRSIERLRSLTLLFSGAPVAGSVEHIKALDHLARERRFTFSAEFVLDRDADACAALGGAPTSLAGILRLSQAMRRAGVRVRWRIPAISALVYRLESLFSLAGDEEIDAVLVRGTDHLADLDDECRRFLSDFIAFRLLHEERPRLSPARVGYYEAMLADLRDRRVDAAEHEPIAVLEEDEDGEWLLRPGDGHPPRLVLDPDPTGATSSSRQPTTAAGDVAEVLGEGVSAIGQWLRTAVSGKARPRTGHGHGGILPRVLVIGAYGGDHIGDTAIVGGVLLRMHRRYQTGRAIVMSQRPDHTRRLVAMLDIPVSVSVHEYRQSTAASLLAQVDAVVFAGGPLMDLPKQLVKHLYTVALARRAGKPFIIEGIGAGPFIRRASAWTARLLVLMAEKITVRTAEDARKPLVNGLQLKIGRDPAFDYLETRGAALTRVPDKDRRWLEHLFEETAGRITIGVNLRPLRPDYTVGTPAAERIRHTRAVETRFEERLAEAMRRFHHASAHPPCFLFFPMNSIQFGSSDLRSAYRVKRLVGSAVDLRIWEGDPSIDGIVALLRRVDVAITMRFHATIYALSQQKRVIGVDYRPGRNDKVTALLDDAGQGHNCRRIDEITADWLFERLQALTQLESSRDHSRQSARISETSLPPVRPPVPT